jgi:hypothetical protein
MLEPDLLTYSQITLVSSTFAGNRGAGGATGGVGGDAGGGDRRSAARWTTTGLGGRSGAGACDEKKRCDEERLGTAI